MTTFLLKDDKVLDIQYNACDFLSLPLSSVFGCLEKAYNRLFLGVYAQYNVGIIDN